MEQTDPLDAALFQRFHELEHRLAQGDPYEELIAAYQAVADEFVPRYETRGDTDKAIATRQSVAASLVLVTTTSNRPLAECEQYFQRMLEVGFHDLSRKAHEVIAFAGYWARQGGRSEMLRQQLQSLRNEVNAEHQRTGAVMWSDYLKRCDALIERLQSNIE